MRPFTRKRLGRHALPKRTVRNFHIVIRYEVAGATGYDTRMVAASSSAQAEDMARSLFAVDAEHGARIDTVLVNEVPKGIFRTEE